MRILIAPDSFKGSLTSAEAAAAMVFGMHSVRPDVDIVTMPLADGGEGTMAVLHALCLGEVRDAMLFDHDTVLIESAGFIALNQESMPEDVFERGSAALGMAVLKALDAGVKDMRIALGGSATVDGGLGLLTALGCRALDADGVAVTADLKGLMQTRTLDIEALDQRLKDVSLTILSDVQNPLCGHDGAALMYGAQKGIEAERLADVEAAMLNWAGLCEDEFGEDEFGEDAFDEPVRDDCGAGAAGGLAFALRLLGGRIVSGAEYVMQASAFDSIASTVDWVVTGEGMSDAQSLHGKLPIIVAKAARKAGARVALISGEVLNEVDLLAYFDDVKAARPVTVSRAEAMRHASDYLSHAAAQWASGLDEA